MALRGTLKNFGIADILQLIGHQGKTGVLKATHGSQRVTVHFLNGGVVQAQAARRQHFDFFGNMLVRAEVITAAQRNSALDTQKRTLRRIGDVLVEMGAVDRETLGTIARLQVTETIYQLFLWEAGTYEFKAADVQTDPCVEPVRADNILMEGFRQVDEWPAIRKKISGYSVTFRALGSLDDPPSASTEATAGQPEADEFGLDDAFGGFEDDVASSNPRLRNIGSNERLLHGLINPKRDVQKLIDLSRLGEFEACKALVNLIDAGFIEAVAETGRRPSAAAIVGGITKRPASRWRGRAASAAVAISVIVGGWLLVSRLDASATMMLLLGEQPLRYCDVSIQEQIGRGQLQHIRRMLDVYRLRFGEYPPSLAELVAQGLLNPRDLSYPWHGSYDYRRSTGGYALVRPVY